jgi:hypothetical protein
MKLERARHDPGEMLEFYENGLGALGALCERTWHDRLEIMAEGRAATLWNSQGMLHEVELHFTPGDTTVARDATREVFPGCPLTFRLAEALRATPLPLERFALPDVVARSPEAAVAEKLWRAQFPDTTRWQLTVPFKLDYHFSLLALARCEVQAIDQHWSLHRMALSLPGGEMDDNLAHEMGFQQVGGASTSEIVWPVPNPAVWRALLQHAFEHELAEELARVQARQEHSLRRELERIDDYFVNYENELAARMGRGANSPSKLKATDRLAAAKAEHTRRRADQVDRHEIRIYPHLDALLLVAERAWCAELQIKRSHSRQTLKALFVPRSRKWEILEAKTHVSKLD